MVVKVVVRSDSLPMQVAKQSDRQGKLLRTLEVYSVSSIIFGWFPIFLSVLNLRLENAAVVVTEALKPNLKFA